jgi:predicted nucleic acid-binding protein
VQGKVRAVVSRQILTELIRNLLKKSPSTVADLQEFIANAPPEVVENPSREQVLAAIQAGVNTDDAAVFAAAILSNADYLVSGDKSFVAECHRAKSLHMVLSPRDFLDRITT